MKTKVFTKFLSLILAAILVFQPSGNVMAETDSQITGSNFNVKETDSNFKEYTDADWDVTFPNGTFIMEYSQYTVKEGGADGTDTYLGINIARFGGKNSEIELSYLITDISSTEADYELNSESIVFLPNEEMKTVYIKIKDNKLHQVDRYFAFTLVDAGKAHIGDFNRAVVKIEDDEPVIPTRLKMYAKSVADKGDGKVSVDLTRTEGVDYYFTVDVITQDDTAKVDEDYLAIQQTVMFSPGETTKSVDIPLIHSDVKDLNGDRNLRVTVKNLKGGENSGPDFVDIRLTNKIPDPSYIKVNSEVLIKGLGEKDKSIGAVSGGESITTNSSGLSVSKTKITTAQKLSMLQSGFNGSAIIQLASIVEIPTEDVIINERKDAPTIFNYKYNIGSDYWTTSNPTINKNDSNMSVSTDNRYNFNDYYQIDIDWGNDDTGTDSLTTLYFNNNVGSANVVTEKEFGIGNYGHDWGYYPLNPVSTEDSSDTWEDYAGSRAFTSGLKFYISNRDGMVPNNYFYIDKMNFKKAIIPFSRLMPVGAVKLSADDQNLLRYTFGGYEYTISLADSGNGAVGLVSETIKGFLINSDLKVQVKSTQTSTASKTPTALYLKDNHFNLHNLNRTTTGTVFSKTTDGYVATINLSTLGILSSAFTSLTESEKTSLKTYANNYANIISGRYTNLAIGNLELTEALHFEIDTVDTKTVQVLYSNAKKLLENSSYSIATLIESIVVPQSATTYYPGSSNPTIDMFDLGTVNFSTMLLNSQSTKLMGGKINIKIMGTVSGKEVNFSSGSGQYSFDLLPSSIVIVLSDPNVQQFDPMPVVNNPGAIKVTDDSIGNFIYDKYITYSGFNNLRFETIHSADSAGYANGGAAFDLNFTSPNLYPPAIGETPLYFKVVIKKQDSDGANAKEMFTFIYEADTTKYRTITPLTIGSTMREVDILQKGKNAFSIAIQSKYDYAQKDQVGQVFLGNENLVVEVYKKDSLANLNANSSKTSLAKSISGNQTMTILQKLPTDKLESDSMNYATSTQKGQDSLMMYKDNTSTMDLPPYNFNLASLGENFGTNKQASSSGSGLSMSGDQITIAFSLNGEPLEEKGKHKTGYERLKELDDRMTEASDAANPVNTGGSKPAKEKAQGKFSVGGGFAITLKYDSMTSSWEFENMLFGLTITGGVDLNQPFIPCPIFYYHMQASFTLSMQMGFKQVPIGYWGGRLNRKVVFSGFSISPSVYLAIGVGAGISGVFGVELSAYITAGLTATFGATEVTMANNIYDFDENKTDIFDFTGTWTSEEDVNSFKHTVLTTTGAKTDGKAASISYTVDAYLILIKGSLLTNGASMFVSITNENNEVVAEKTVSTKNSVSKSDCTLFMQNMIKRDLYTVTITYLDSNTYGAKLALDETNYRTLEGDGEGAAYETKTKPATLDAWNVQFGIKIDIYLLFFSFSIDLIYFYVNQDGYGWGYPKKQNQIKEFSKGQFSYLGSSDFMNEIPRGTDYIDYTAAGRTKAMQLMLMESLGGSNAKYDLGDASDSSLETIAGNVMQTTTSRIFQIGTNYIMFWTIDDLTRSADQRTAIMYSINGSPAVILDNDGLMDGELAAAVNSAGTLQVVWASSTGQGIDPTASSIIKLEQINNSMQIKTCAINLSTKTKSPIAVINGTNDTRCDTLPAFTGKSGNNVIISVKDVQTEYSANVKSGYTPPADDPDGAIIASNLDRLQNAQQTGVNKLFYTLDKGNGYSALTEIPIGIDAKVWRAGTKITSTSAEFLNDNTVLIAFTAEIPNSQKGGFGGIEKMLFVQKGVISGNTILFADGAICVDEIFDYEDSLNVVFADSTIPVEYSEHIDGTDTGTETIDNPVISNVSFKKVSLPENGGQASIGLTLFYKNKSKLFAIKEEVLKKAVDLTNHEALVFIPILTMGTDQYDLNVTQSGDMYIVYNNLDKKSMYDSAMMLRYYDKNTGLWGDAKQLTFNNSYSQTALDNGVAGVFAVNFKKISSYIDTSGNIKILALSTASEFKYDTYTPEGETLPIRLAYLDSATALRNIDLISYSVSKNAVFEGQKPEIDSDLVIPGEESVFTIKARNTSDVAMNGGKIQLLCRLANGTEEEIGSKSIEGFWVAGAENTFEFIWSVDSASGNKYNNAIIYYKIYNAGNYLVYHSLDKSLSYQIKQDRPEILIVSDGAVIIQKEDGDYIQYNALIKNTGFANPTKANLALSIVDYDADFILTEKGTPLITVPVPLDKLSTTASYTAPTNFTVEVKVPIGMKTSYKVRAVVKDVDNEVNLQNNIGSLSILYPSTEIILGYEDSQNMLTATVGDEIILDLFSLTSDLYTPSDVVFEEADTTYLSIDNISNPSKPRIKIMSGPDTGYKTVTLNARIKGTNIMNTLKINVSKRKLYNFGDATSTLVNFNKIEALENYQSDIVLSNSANSTITFNVKGNLLELYGNKSSSSGKFRLDMYNGSTLIHTYTVDTISSTAQFDVLLYTLSITETMLTLRVVITSLDTQALYLDRAEVDGTVLNLPASEAYAVMTEKTVALDLPKQSGRLRQGIVSFDFDTDIGLNSGVIASNFKLKFHVAGIKNGISTSLSDVNFTYSEINGKTISFICSELASSAQYDSIIYTLADNVIPSGYIKALNNSTLKLVIPDADNISYKLAESKISKVEIVDVSDSTKQDKGVLVTFEKPMMEARLLNTKIMYTRKIGVQSSEVAFTYTNMPENNQALYTIAKTTMDRSEDQMDFAVKNGIVLSNSYSMVSSDGNYVDNIITASSNLSFSYKRAQALQTNVWRDIDSGEKISASIEYDKTIDVTTLTRDDAKITVQKTISKTGLQDITQNVTLYYSGISADRYTLKFTSDQQTPYNNQDLITYALAKSFVIDSAKLKSTDGEFTNNKVSTSLEAKVSFRTEAFISAVNMSTESTSFAQTGNKPMVVVRFSTLIKEDTLNSTFISAQGVKTTDGLNINIPITLSLLRIEKYKDSSETLCTRAVYTYTGTETFDFSEKVTDIQFIVSKNEISGLTGSILNSTGGIIIENSLNYSSGTSNIKRSIPTSPVVAIKKGTETYNPTDWSKQTLTASATGTGTYQYSTDGGTWTNFSTPVTLNKEGTVQYSFRLLDTLGIASKSVAQTTKIDTKTPTLLVRAKTSDGLDYTSGTITKKAVTFTISESSAVVSGIKSYSYDDGSGNKTMTGNTITTESDGTVNRKSYTFKATSNSLVESSATTAFKVKIQPVLDVETIYALFSTDATGVANTDADVNCSVKDPYTLRFDSFTETDTTFSQTISGSSLISSTEMSSNFKTYGTQNANSRFAITLQTKEISGDLSALALSGSQTTRLPVKLFTAAAFSTDIKYLKVGIIKDYGEGLIQDVKINMVVTNNSNQLEIALPLSAITVAIDGNDVQNTVSRSGVFAIDNKSLFPVDVAVEHVTPISTAGEDFLKIISNKTPELWKALDVKGSKEGVALELVGGTGKLRKNVAENSTTIQNENGFGLARFGSGATADFYFDIHHGTRWTRTAAYQFETVFVFSKAALDEPVQSVAFAN